MSQTPTLVHRTIDGVDILVSRGEKSEHDFRVHYREPDKRQRTPKHIHLIIDLFMKLTGNRELTLQLIDRIIEVIGAVRPNTTFPPRLQMFAADILENYEQLNQFGDYSVEFHLVVGELILIQEKTNYPNGTMSINLYKKLRNGGDIFSLVSAATFNNR